MKTPSRRTFTHAAILLGVGLFALGGASLIPPLRAVERWIVKRVAVALEPVDTILDGDGSQETPWTRRQAVPPVVPPAPRILSIDDDPERWFSASPLAPVDFNVIFARLADAGHKTLGVGHLMAWDEPEALAMEALRKQLDRFDPAVLALPLARGAAPEPVAAPFLRWSIEAEDATGKVSGLPQVNRVAVPNAELGGAKTVAGFSLLENEKDPGDGTQPLLAQWGDRVVFAFPLAVEIAAQGLQPADVMVRVGKEIRLGVDGPVIPIDGFGRGRVANPDVLAIEAPAMRLISENNPLPPTAQALVTRDVRAALGPAEKVWSDHLAANIQALRSAQRFQQAVPLPRPEALMELALVMALAFFGTWSACQKHVAWRIVTAVGVVGLGAQLLYLFASRQNLWLPPLAILAPGVAALLLAFTRRGHAPAVAEPVPMTAAPVAEVVVPVPEVVAPTAPVEPIVTDEPELAPAKKTARKAAKKPATKTAAKKAAKKAPAKKAARKSPRKPADEENDAAE